MTDRTRIAELEENLRATTGALRDSESLRRQLVEGIGPPAARHLLEKSLLLEVGQAVSRTLDLEVVLQTIADGTARLLEVETAAIYLLEGEDLFLGATTPPLDPAMPPALRWAKLIDHPHLARAVLSQQPVVLEDARAATLSPAEQVVVEVRGLRSIVYVPYLHEAAVVGVLILGTVSKPRSFSADDLALCETVASQLALGIQNVRLHARLKEHAAELRREIDQRARVEAALRTSEERFRALFEQAGDYILLLEMRDDGDLVIADANAAACAHHGYSRDELIGMSIGALDPDFRPGQLDERLRLMRGGQALRFETTHRRRDGSTFPVEVSATLVDFGGGASFIMSIERDIAERRRAREVEQQLLQAQKMEAVGQLAGGVAHDFNNLLHVITGYTGLLQECTRLNDEDQEYLECIAQASTRAAELVRQLLVFSRRQVLEMKVVDLNALVGNLMQMMRRLLGDNLELVVTPDPELRRIQADPGQLEQIIVNLLVNARDAMPAGGSIALTTENVMLDEAFCAGHRGMVAGPHVCIRVADTGCGMDPEVQARIFEPFFTTKGPGAGTGLGLSTVFGLVEQHHGCIALTSAVGQGSTFEVYLPVAERAEVEAAALAPGRAVGGAETILLAEDHAMVRDLVRTHLTQVGYTVLSAADGEQALQLFAANAARIDLVILDAVMPKLDGAAVLRRLRELRPGVPVLLSSGHTVAKLQIDELRRHGVALLQKPYARELLLQRIREVLDAPG